MSAPKNYSTKSLTKKDEPEIEEALKEHPLWSRRAARELVARRKFQRRIAAAGDPSLRS